MPNRTTPVDGQPWPFADFIRDSPLWAPSGVVGLPAASASAGDLGLSFDIVSGTSVTPKLALGRGRSRGARYERTVSPWTSGMSGAQPQDGSAAYTLNSGSNPRRDRIVLRRDIGLQAVYPIILPGTPAASPVAATLQRSETGLWDTPLFSWTLPGGSSTAPANITDERPWIHPFGLHPVRSRFVVATASGSLASGSAVDICAPQVLPALEFDSGVAFQLDIDARIQMVIPNGAGAKLELLVNGTLAGQDNVGNGGTGGATYTLKARDPAYRTTDDQVTVRAVLTAISGTLTAIASGRLFITAQPYVDL